MRGEISSKNQAGRRGRNRLGVHNRGAFDGQRIGILVKYERGGEGEPRRGQNLIDQIFPTWGGQSQFLVETWSMGETEGKREMGTGKMRGCCCL